MPRQPGADQLIYTNFFRNTSAGLSDRYPSLLKEDSSQSQLTFPNLTSETIPSQYERRQAFGLFAGLALFLLLLFLTSPFRHGNQKPGAWLPSPHSLACGG